jgi:DNA-binding MarR family transcriptional regulator
MDGYRADESLGFLINRLAAAMRAAFENRLDQYGLTAQQFGFLARLYEEDSQPLSAIGRRMYCDKPTITGIANRLERKGLIKKVRDEEDRRVFKAILTEKGRGLEDVLLQMALNVNLDVMKGLSEEDMRAFKRLLRKALNNALGMIEGGVINV